MTDFSQCFQFSDGSSQLTCALFQFLEQPHILDGDHRLIRECFKQRYLFVRKGPHLCAANSNGPDCSTLTHQWHGESSSDAQLLYVPPDIGIILVVFCQHVVNVHRLPVNYGATAG